MTDLGGDRPNSNPAGQARGSSQRQRRRNLHFFALEPRIMYDGAAVATAVDHHAADGASAASAAAAASGAPVVSEAAPPPPPPSYQPPTEQSAERASMRDVAHDAPVGSRTEAATNEIVFIDSSVPDLSTLLAGLREGQEAHILDAGSDGLQQISDYIRDHGLDDLTAIQIVSHGSEGELRLGSTMLTEANMASYSGALAEIGASLSADGDILLYGCDIGAGAAGDRFLSALANHTGADVSASSDPTGATARGGDWDLEKSTGAIEAGLAFSSTARMSWDHLLATTLTVSQTTYFQGDTNRDGIVNNGEDWSTSDIDGDGVADPGDIFTIEVTINNTGGEAANNVQLSELLAHLDTPNPNVRITPIALDDIALIDGNTPRDFTVAELIGNDLDPGGNAGSLLIASVVSGANGTVTIIDNGVAGASSDDIIRFTPNTGYEGTATFTYFVIDSQNLTSVQSATVTVTVDDPVWYVDSAAAGGGDGSYANPFKTIAELNAGGAFNGVNDANDRIFFTDRGTAYTGAVNTLATGQHLLGDGSALTTVNGISVGAGTTNSTISVGGTAAAVTLGANNTVQGLDLVTTSTTATALSDNAASVGNLAVSAVSISGIGKAVDIDNGGNLNVTLQSVSSTGTAGEAIDLGGVSGSFIVQGATTIDDSGDAGIHISGALAGFSADFQGNTSIINDAPGTGGGVLLNSNAANATIHFASLNLDVGEAGVAAGQALVATSGGRLKIDAGTINSNGSLGADVYAVDISNTTSTGVTFNTLTIDHDDGGESGGGIRLVSNTGAFTFESVNRITGFNASMILASSGGTLNLGNTAAGNIETSNRAVLDIVNTTIDINATVVRSSDSTGNGIALSGVGGTLDVTGTTTVTGSVLDGIFIGGASSAGVTFAGTTISGTGDEGIEINGTSGTVTFSSVTINGVSGAGIEINGATGTVNVNGGAIGNTDDPGSFGVNVTGGSGNVTVAASVAKTSTSAVVQVFDHDSGTVTFSGNLTTTGGNVSPIFIGSNGGGTINFTGQSISLSNGANNGITLINNAGGTINFAPTAGGNGLDIVTTNGTGFSAIGGGTVTVQGTGNTIASTTGTAVSVLNTTIGAADLNFQSISANGGTNGIVLNNTGAVGGLTVTGNGGTVTSAGAATGGAIQNSTGAGILLTDVGGGVSLTRMYIGGGGDDGIRGTRVTGFTLANSLVTGNGNAVGERGIDLIELGGSGGISSSTITGSAETNLRIENDLVNLTSFNITGSTFSNTNMTTGDDGILILNTGSAAMTVSVTGSTFTDNRGDHFQAATDANATGTMNITFNDNVLNTTAGNDPNVLGGGITINTSGALDIVFQVNNNNIQQAFDDAININLDPGSLAGASMNGTISGNTIGSPGVLDSGSESSNAITIGSKGAGSTTINVTNNFIYQWANTYGIFIGTTEGSSNVNALVSGNTVKNPGTFGLNGIRIDAGATAGDNGLLEVTLVNNDVTGSGGSAGSPGVDPDIRLRQRFNTTIKLPGYAGGNSDTAAVNTFVAQNNDPVSTPTVTSAHNVGGGGGGYVGGPDLLILAPTTDPGPSDTSLPAETPPDPSDTGAAEPDAGDQTAAPYDPPPPADETAAPPAGDDTVATPPPNGIYVDDGVLSQAELDATLQAAIARWIETGLTAEQIEALRNVHFTLADMPGLYLGAYSPDGVRLDFDAAGYGWYVDSTPLSDGEFTLNGDGRLIATGQNGQIDLLTTIMHELGHALGLSDNYAQTARASLMYGFLPAGERRLPATGLATGAVVGSITTEEYAIGTVGLGTLPAGKTVKVYFDAVVLDDQFNAVIQPVSSTPTVDWNDSGGAHSVTGAASTVTVDSLTLGDRIFVDTNNNGLYDATEGVSGVALTLFIDNDNSGDLSAGDVDIATTSTGADGLYSFANLAPGNYIVRVDASNFTAGGALYDSGTATAATSLPGTPSDPDDNVDRDDNGQSVAIGLGGGVASQTISLGYDSEPDGTPDSDGDADADTNLTLDFGFSYNQPPAVADLNGDNVSFTEGGSPVKLDVGGNAAVTDTDSANFEGGNLTVSITAGEVAGEDVLGIDTSGPVTVSVLGVVSVGGVDIGTVTSDGTGGSDLVIAFNADATAARVSLLVQALTYSNSNLNNPSTTPRTVAVTIADGDGATSAASNVTVGVTAVNDAPVNTVPGPQAVNEDTDLVFSAGNGNAISISDVDIASGNAQVTLSVTNGVLTLSQISGLSFTTGDGTGDATMVFSGTLADVNAALAGLTYRANLNYSGPDSLSLTVSDLANTGSGGAQSDTDSVAITVDAVNDAPVNTVPGPQAVAEDADLVFSAGNGNAISISDVDIASGNAQVTLSVANGVLTLSQISGLSFTTGDGTGDTTMVFSGTLSDINAALVGLTYRANLNYAGPDSLSLTVSDLNNTGSGGAQGDTDSVAITVNAVNDAPENTVPGPQAVNEDTDLVFSAGNGNAISISDVDIASGNAQVTLSASNGVLTLSQISGLSFTTGDGTGDTTMTFSGTLADINAALAGLTYRANLNYAGPDTLNLTVSDLANTGSGGAQSDTDSVAITVDAVNDAPVNTVPGPQAVAEDTDLVFSGGNAISIADSDVGGDTLQVTLSVANGVLSLSQINGLSFSSGDGTQDVSMTFTGTLSDINAALAGLTYRANLNYAGPDTLSLTVNDQGNTGAGVAQSDTDSVAITVNAVNDAPVNTVPGPQAVNEDTDLVFSGGNGNAIAISDVDIASGNAQVTLSVANGVLTLSQISGLSFTTGDGTGDSTMVFSGSLSDINAALAGLTYRANLNYSGPDTLNLTVSDLANTGSGGAQGDTDSVAITVDAVNNAPVNTVPGPQAVDEDANLVFSAGNGNALSVSDIDLGGGDLQVTLSVANGILTLSQTAGLSFTAGDGTDDSIMVFTGTAVDINAALAGLTYRANANYNGADTLTLTTNDQGNSGADPGLSGDGTSEQDQDTVAIIVNPVNDAPVNTLPGPQAVAEDADLVFSAGNGNAISISDVDIAGGNAQVTLSVANGVLTLSQISGLSFTTGDGTGDTTMTFTGSLSDINLALAGLTYRANVNYSGSDTLSLTVSDLANTGSGGAQGDTDSVAITVDAVNDAPVNTVPGPQAVNEDTDLVFSVANGNALSVSDVDIASGSAQVTLTATNGLLTLSQTSGLAFAVGDGTANVTMTFTGTLSAINAALDGLTYRANPDYDGSALLQITTSDQGNSGAGGTKTDTNTVAITVDAVNDEPSFTAGPDQTVNEDAGSVTVNGWATNIQKGPANESGQTLTFDVSNDNNGLFSVQPTIDANGNLTYTTAANAFGTATVTVVLRDNGGTANGGDDTSQTATFTITIDAVNDAPVNTVPGPQAGNEDTDLVFSTGNGNVLSVADIDLAGGNLQVTLSAANGVLTLSQISGLSFTIGDGSGDATMVFTGTAADINAALDGLIYRANANYNGADTVTLSSSDQGSSGSGGAQSDADTVAITVNPVNDEPSFTKGVDQTVNEDAGPQTVNGWATNIQKGPANESGQALTFDVTTTNNALFSVLPTIDANGNLTYTTAANAFGTATVTVVLRDNGGTANGGDDTATTQTFTITVNPVNDAPDLAPDVNPAFYNANSPGAVTVFPNVTVTDVDNTTLTGATVVIAFGKQSGDALQFTNQNGITGSYNPATGVLTLSGNASIADYQAALRSITFSSTTQQPVGVRTISWVVNDGAAQSNLSEPATTLLAVIGRIDHHHHGDYGYPGGGGGYGGPPYGGYSDRFISYDPRPFAFPQGFGQGSGIHFVRADAGLTINADRTYEIALPMFSIGAPLAGDIAILSVTLADGSPLPSWLVFDATTGKLAGLLPDGMVASLDLEQGSVDVVTGALPPNSSVNGSSASGTNPERLEVRVVARDSHGNIAIMTFTIVLRPAQQGFMPSHDRGPVDTARSGDVIVLPPERIAWALDRDAWSRAAESRSAAALMAAVDQGEPAALAGRASLAQQIERSGWRSLSSDRSALLSSLREGAGVWR
jgi:hypothetical protein